MADFLQSIQIPLAGIATLAIYSYLIKENLFYRFFEHLFIGIATAITMMRTFETFFWEKFFKPVFGLDRIPYPDGTFPEPYNTYNLLYLIPIAFGLLYYCILFKRTAWLAQIAIGLSLGASAGLSFKGFFNEIMPLLYDSFRPIYVSDSLAQSLYNTIFIVTLFSVLAYFVFTVKGAASEATAKAGFLGRWLMMGFVGAMFGSTVPARMALLVERINFLYFDWIPSLV